MPILLDLFLTFLKIGALSFGGGYGMISLLTEEVISHGWLSESEILNFIAVSESTPGPIAINMATFVGSSQGGFLGAILATLGVILPAFIIILIVASVASKLLEYAGIKSVLKGVRPVVVGLIVATGLYMTLTVVIGFTSVKESISFDYKALIIFAVDVGFYAFYRLKKKTSPPVLLLIGVSAVLGIILYGLIV